MKYNQHRYFLVSGILFLFLILYIELVTITASIAQLLDFLDDGRWFSSLVKYVPLSKIVIIGTLLLIAIVFAAYAITRNDQVQHRTSSKFDKPIFKKHGYTNDTDVITATTTEQERITDL